MDLSIYPLPFFLSAIALIASGLFAWKHRRQGWGLPMGAVLGTVAFWYHGDGLYNDYERYQVIIGDKALNAAWWQVLLFIVTFSFLVLPVHMHANKRFLKRRSHLMLYAETNKIEDPVVQIKIDRVCKMMLKIWLVLMTIAIVRTGFDFEGMFAPYLSDRAYPWLRGRMGGGISALLSLAGYIQLLLAAGFGVVAAVAKNPKTRMVAIVICCLAFPYYIFDRTRNSMIATMLPGLLAYVFMRLKGGIWKKVIVLTSAFVLTSYWFAFVVENPIGRGLTVEQAFAEAKKKKVQEAEAVLKTDKDLKHQGVSMFSELGYINLFISDNIYSPNWGRRYFAEVVNVVPRALWKGKPTIGFDYAIARGFGGNTNAIHTGGLKASIATGMIGQGVVNFGRIFGPMFAALLVSIWVVILARLDLTGSEPARLFLCVVGLILTFNMGRDITLLVLYPFVFGLMLILAVEWWQAKKREQHVSAPVRRHRQSPPR